jgi:hypothetical protein
MFFSRDNSTTTGNLRPAEWPVDSRQQRHQFIFITDIANQQHVFEMLLEYCFLQWPKTFFIYMMPVAE